MCYYIFVYVYDFIKKTNWDYYEIYDYFIFDKYDKKVNNDNIVPSNQYIIR